MSMRCVFPASAILTSVVLAFTGPGASAGSLTPLEELSIGETGSGSTGTLSSGSAVLNTPLGIQIRGMPGGTDLLEDPLANGNNFSAFVGLAGPLGMVVNYASGKPRVSGLALLPSDSVRVEASGGVDPGFESFRGRVSVHIRF